MSVIVKYGAVAPYAKETFEAIATDIASFTDVSVLEQSGVKYPLYGNPCELYSVALDGTQKPLPDDLEGATLGYWSESVADDEGVFETPIVLTFDANGERFTSDAISFVFDASSGIYPSSLNIKWYRAGSVLESVDFQPDKASYVCVQKVEAYDKVVVTVYEMSVPNNRLKVQNISYGIETEFAGAELKSVRQSQSIDPLCVQIPINSCNISIISQQNIDFSFQAKQPLSIYHNGNLVSTSFVNKATRRSKKVWDIDGEDYIGIMEDVAFYGGIYNQHNALGLISQIFDTAGVPYEIVGDFSNATVSGYIPYTNCREALKQVCFVIGAVVDTSRSDNVKIRTLDDAVSQKVPLERIMRTPSFEEEARVTKVEVYAHTYERLNETVTVFDANNSGTGENIFVKFNEPLHSLSISNGTIHLYSTNHAIITANSGCVLTGKRYKHTSILRSISNPLAVSSDANNVVTVSNATLVSVDVLDNVAQRCYNYITKAHTASLKIAESRRRVNGEIVNDQPVYVGDNIDIETEYLGDISGRVIKQSFALIGNTVVKDTEMRY